MTSEHILTKKKQTRTVSNQGEVFLKARYEVHPEQIQTGTQQTEARATEQQHFQPGRITERKDRQRAATHTTRTDDKVERSPQSSDKVERSPQSSNTHSTDGSQIGKIEQQHTQNGWITDRKNCHSATAHTAPTDHRSEK